MTSRQSHLCIFLLFTLAECAPTIKDQVAKHNEKRQQQLRDQPSPVVPDPLPECASSHTDNSVLRVMSINTWFSAYSVNDGLTKLAKHIQRMRPDIVLLQELQYEYRMRQLLDLLGKEWTGGQSYDDVVLTRHQMLSGRSFATGWTYGSSIYVGRLNLTVHTVGMHLQWRDYGPYALLRGEGTDAEKRERATRGDIRDDGQGRLQNVEELEAQPQFKQALRTVLDEPSACEVIVLGGDFNEPSHLDWTAETSELHGGWQFEWPVTKHLGALGFKDSYRELIPNAHSAPGVTWTTVNKEASEPQDRIDFIFYLSDRLRPQCSFAYAGDQPIEPSSNADYVHNDWPSDHYAVVTDFRATAC